MKISEFIAEIRLPKDPPGTLNRLVSIGIGFMWVYLVLNSIDIVQRDQFFLISLVMNGLMVIIGLILFHLLRKRRNWVRRTFILIFILINFPFVLVMLFAPNGGAYYSTNFFFALFQRIIHISYFTYGIVITLFLLKSNVRSLFTANPRKLINRIVLRLVLIISVALAFILWGGAIYLKTLIKIDSQGNMKMTPKMGKFIKKISEKDRRPAEELMGIKIPEELNVDYIIDADGVDVVAFLSLDFAVFLMANEPGKAHELKDILQILDEHFQGKIPIAYKFVKMNKSSWGSLNPKKVGSKNVQLEKGPMNVDEMEFKIRGKVYNGLLAKFEKNEREFLFLSYSPDLDEKLYLSTLNAFITQ